MIRWLSALVLVGVLSAGCGSSSSGGAAAGQKTVGFVQFTSTASMDDLRNGFQQGLKEGGFEDGKNLKLVLKNSEADQGTLDLMVKGYVQDNVDLVATSSTPALQSALRNVKDQPVVFMGVVNPKVAGVDDSKTNVTGVFNPFPVGKGVELVHEIVPGAKTIGSLADTGEPFTAGLVEQAKAECARVGLRWVSVPVTSSNDIASGTQALKAQGADVLMQLPSNLMNQGLDGQIKVARSLKMPMFSIQTEQVARGVIAAIGLDLVDAGRQAGVTAAKILNGGKPADFPIEPVKKQPLKVNLKAAESFGVTIPKSVLDRAEKV